MKRGAAALGLAVLFASGGDARAFCRKTTCDRDKGACPEDEHGCATTGAPLRHEGLPIPYRFSARGTALLVREEARQAVRAAFQRWSDAVCPDGVRTSLRFKEDEDLPGDKPLAAGSRGVVPFGVYFRDLGWPYVGKEDSTLAQTNQSYGVESGLVRYADIEINSGARRFATSEAAEGIDLQAVLTHEVGHYIGLDHSREPESIMRASYCEAADGRCDSGKVAARRLAPDDLAAVCALYPSTEPPPGDTPANPACAAARAADASSPWPAAACALLAATARARRRRGVR